MRPGRRLHRRKLARPATAKASPQEEEIPVGIPVEAEEAEESTLIDAEPVATPRSSKTSTSTAGNETVELPVPAKRPADPNEETEGPLDGDLEPEPPDQLSFTCPCGVRLVATRKAYGKRMRCGKCQTLMLISVVYDPAGLKFEIEPFRVDVPDLPT